MTDPFVKFETLARGHIPTPPPPPAMPDQAPRTAIVEGVKITSDRLIELDRIARTHRATQAGMAERVADLRADRQDAARRLSLLAARAAGDPTSRAETAAPAAEVQREIETINATIRETEAELNASAAAAGAARQNLKAAIDLARDYALAVPAGLNEENRRA